MAAASSPRSSPSADDVAEADAVRLGPVEHGCGRATSRTRRARASRGWPGRWPSEALSPEPGTMTPNERGPEEGRRGPVAAARPVRSRPPRRPCSLRPLQPAPARCSPPAMTTRSGGVGRRRAAGSSTESSSAGEPARLAGCRARCRAMRALAAEQRDARGWNRGCGRNRPRTRSMLRRSITLAGNAGRAIARARSRVSDGLQRALGTRPPISPMMPRRNASTQTTKMAPCVTVTQAPNWAR